MVGLADEQAAADVEGECRVESKAWDTNRPRSGTYRPS